MQMQIVIDTRWSTRPDLPTRSTTIGNMPIVYFDINRATTFTIPYTPSDSGMATTFSVAPQSFPNPLPSPYNPYTWTGTLTAPPVGNQSGLFVPVPCCGMQVTSFGQITWQPQRIGFYAMQASATPSEPH
jgi:hypothetical protein